ncbi:hypothetical protein [Oceanirhabdus sp. W0125-5]|uniref:hypothetical protein n=1 Tax=Oceanirhabdus sp. W0125-5 TaxID=2999116 RepID=UPI0022F2F4BB|nr:hypothetical protein [Oceanirhabdus sp. W0125-5]WBW96087.1 hypothetical protein OW730_20685 [Oceanirhabdus sp. W0125-5]
MISMVSHFSKIIDYLERFTTDKNERIDIDDDIKEQRENLEDLKDILSEFQKSLDELDSHELIESESTVKKLLLIHKYITDLEWHISEMSDLNTKVIKTFYQ